MSNASTNMAEEPAVGVQLAEPVGQLLGEVDRWLTALYQLSDACG